MPYIFMNDMNKYDWRDVIIWISIALGIVLLIASFFKGVK